MDLNFEFEQQITEEFVLKYLTEETIFCHYMDIPYITKKLYRSIVRDDDKPTCGFFKKSRLYLRDFATGDCYDCFGLVSRLYKCSYYDALKQVANDFNLVKTKSLQKIEIVPTFKDRGRSKIQIEKQEFTNEQLEWWNQYGITKDILDKYEVYSCKSIFLNDNLNAVCNSKCPIYGYYMGFDKVELWRIYFPFRTSYRFLSNTPSTLIQGLKQLPNNANLLVITKSMKDCMTLYNLGIPAIAPNSEHLFISDDILIDLKKRFKHIIILYDNDYAGICGMSKIKKKHPELIYSWIPRDFGCKDISDLYKTFGNKKVKSLIKKYLKIVFKL